MPVAQRLSGRTRQRTMSVASVCGTLVGILILTRNRNTRRRGTVDDLPLALRGKAAQLAAEDHLEHFATTVGVDLHDETLPELGMVEAHADLVARLDQFVHSSNS